MTYETLVAFCDNARREFYLRPKYLLAKAIQAVTHPGEFKRLAKGGLSLFRYIFKPSIERQGRKSEV
jgi:anaerobic magnesium-protoporphyrin IX monomethyl ester cyclase